MALRESRPLMGDEAYDEHDLSDVDGSRRTLVVRGGWSRTEIYIGICRSKDDQPDELIAVDGIELKRILRSMQIGEPRRRK